MNYEYCLGGPNMRGNVLPKSEIPRGATDKELYLSLFGFDNTIHEYLEVNKDAATGKKSVSGFNGSYFCDFLYFDIDRDGDLAGSLASARELVKRLYNRFQLAPKHLAVAFSGSKGFHIGIHQSVFGGFAPAPELPMQVNVLAARLVAEAYDLTLEQLQSQVHKRSYADVDLGIYNPNRIFRATNSRNAKSGLYKIPLTATELLSLDVAEIMALAVSPRQGFVPEGKLTGLVPNTGLVNMWEYARNFDVAAFNQRTGKLGGAPDGDFFAPPTKGDRNNTLFRQACHLFEHGELHESHVHQIMQSINVASGDPLPDDELQTVVRSAFKRVQSSKRQSVIKPKEAVSDKVELWSDWTEEWLDYYTQERCPQSLLFEDMDEDQQHSLKGKLGIFIGSGGTRKSYYLKNMIATNILANGTRAIYSSMEMGKPEVVNRIMDIIMDSGEQALPASRYMQAQARENKDGTREMLRASHPIFANQLILSNNAGKTPADYEQDIQNAIRLYGSLDELYIDGLSAMGGKGKDETERYSQNTLELKELAKRYNIFIGLICHTTKQGAAWLRDCRPFVRGSEKILDNCDFSICFSTLIDETKSTPENLEYMPHLGHIKYYNKRGSGRTISRVYQMDPVTKRISDPHIAANVFPEYEQFVRDYNRRARQSEKQAGEQPW